MASQAIYQFYAELDDYEPKVWRRFQVTKNITAARFGYIVMTLFEMQASHLFCIDVLYGASLFKRMQSILSKEESEKMFSESEITKTYRYEVQNELTVDFDDPESRNAIEYSLPYLVGGEGDELVFSYDYGDGWKIKIVLEKIFKDKELPGRELPRVLAGEGYGIIEDCGGTDGLKRMAKAVKCKKGEQYEWLCGWLDVPMFDLETFDVSDMNMRLKKVPRIYADIYEYGMEPTKKSMDLLMRKYKKPNK